MLFLDIKIDLLFLLDGSGSVTTYDFGLMIGFVQDVVKGFDLENIRVGVMQYSHWYQGR